VRYFDPMLRRYARIQSNKRAAVASTQLAAREGAIKRGSSITKKSGDPKAAAVENQLVSSD
jgi:hypothetical protein